MPGQSPTGTTTGESLPGAGGYLEPILAVTNAIIQGFQNRANRRYEQDMYQQQYRDNINFWHMQNDYNSPIQQIERLKAAGLNPALMYSGGQSGGTAGSIKSPSQTATSQQAPKLGILEFASLKKLGAETSILEEQAEALRLQNKLERHKAKGQDGVESTDWRAYYYHQEQMLKASQIAMETSYTEEMRDKIAKDLELIEATISDIGARNLGYKAILEIWEMIKTITDFDRKRDVIINKIKE